MKKLLLLFIIFLMSCAAPKVITDFEETTDFSKLKTYGYYENSGKNLNELDVKRVIKIIDSTLIQKGFTFSEAPNFFIDFDVKKIADAPRNSIAIGFGNAGRNSVFGVSGGIPIGSKKIIKKLTIQFLSPNNEQLLWQGSLESTVKNQQTPQEKEAYFEKIIVKILNEFFIKI